MKILVTGACGQIGNEIIKLSNNFFHMVIGASRIDLDITNENAVNRYVGEIKPDAIIHCAAYTSVEKAEMESDLCYRVNVLGTKHLVKWSEKHNTKFLFLSSDYVFDGNLDRPYEVGDETNPINVYGKSKLLGELIVKKRLKKYFIIRTSWVFGNGMNFVKNMLQLAKSDTTIRVVNDQIGSPTYAFDLAKLVYEMIVTDEYGTYHATNDGFCSWYEFACEVFKLKKISANIIPISSENYLSLVKRPKNSRLSKAKLEEVRFNRLPSWRVSLDSFLENI